MINSNFGFTPLKEVWLGDCYPESFYDHLPNEIADPFRLITEWTKQDLNTVEQFLKAQGIKVVRPQFNSIDDHITEYDTLVRPPICPRDHYIVLDQTLYSLHNCLYKDQWQHAIDNYKHQGFNVQQPVNQPINVLCPPSMVRMGTDVYIDPQSHEHNWGFLSEYLLELGKKYRVNICDTGGHSDGIFCPVQEGLIVSSHYKANYSESFPGWEVYKIPDNLHNYTSTFTNQWSVNYEIDNNTKFSKFIQDYAKDWVGEFKETVFEVNMLVINETNVIAMKEYTPLVEFLEKRGITVHTFDFRTRSFWDGGWHCLTLDIEREDTKQDLFPERGVNGVYWRNDNA